ncbi:AraC family transcriptional regulator [Streptomyces sp. WAC 06738]|nr:AraC family transcriptional regulator [Streptomyces sp. WAC 06738]
MFRTEDVPAEDRGEALREHLSRLHAPLDLAGGPVADYHAELRLLRLGNAFVWPSVFGPVEVRRTPRLIRQSDPEVFHLSMIVNGTVGAHMDRRDSVFGPYEFRTNHSSRPVDIRTGIRGDVVEAVSVDVPSARLALSPDRVDRVLGRKMTGRAGIGSLLAGFLTSLTAESGAYTAADLPRLETVLVDLLSALLAHETEAEDRLPPETRSRTLALEIQSFIRRRLHDPELTPGAVAAAHHISPSYLHRLFRTHVPGATVGGWIRRQRLERARLMLGDPAQRALPVHLVASRCGFGHHEVFTRAFCAAYGQTPRDYRQAALTRTPPASPPEAKPATDAGRG